MGETTHSVVWLNQPKISEEEIEAFADAARLIVMDEISFANQEDCERYR